MMLEHEREEILIERSLDAPLDRRVAAPVDENLGRQQQRRARRTGSCRSRCGPDELRALDELGVNLLTGVNLFLELRSPRHESVCPRLHVEGPLTDAIDGERAVP